MSDIYQFCPQCGSNNMRYIMPEGDNRLRNVCGDCHRRYYVNPNVVVGAVVKCQEQYLLCKRNIEPQCGLWTYPAGFLEKGETLEEGTIREIEEESKANVELEHLLGVYSLVAVEQVHIIYQARMLDEHYATTAESSEVCLFNKENIPWDELAFPVIRWALKAALNHEASSAVHQRSTKLPLQESLLKDID